MGLLSEGKPLSWNETKSVSGVVRKVGLQQFIKLYKKHKDRQKDPFYWGDEVEYMLIKFDDKRKTAKVALKSDDVLKDLEHMNEHQALWHPEGCSYMVEGIPGKAYEGLIQGVNMIQNNMNSRRRQLQRCLGKGEVPLCLPSFPRLGVGMFSEPFFPIVPNNTNGIPHSRFIPDQIYCLGHPRFITMANCIAQRKGNKPDIQIPVFIDKKTKFSCHDNTKEGYIYMDSNAFGVGCCGLQVTMQAANLNEARTLYDQLTALCPIMLALSAASPLYRGHLSDVDVRWPVLSQAFDDRTVEEKGYSEFVNPNFSISKSRWDSVHCYLTPTNEHYNDNEVVVDPDIVDELQRAGVDYTFAKHIAHLFIRDPVFLTDRIMERFDEGTDFFNSILSTNWQTVRLKPPSLNGTEGWRVEFRPMEVQLSSFENAAFSVFIMLFTRLVVEYGINCVIPISKVDENMTTAYKRDAVNKEKFHFRKSILTDPSSTSLFQGTGSTAGATSQCCDTTEEYREMSLDEIINGNNGGQGLINLMQSYMKSIDLDSETNSLLQRYLKLISQRAAGTEPTIAQSIRNFVTTHIDYKQDSLISETVNYDLLRYLDKLAERCA